MGLRLCDSEANRGEGPARLVTKEEVWLGEELGAGGVPTVTCFSRADVSHTLNCW